MNRPDSESKYIIQDGRPLKLVQYGKDEYRYDAWDSYSGQMSILYNEQLDGPMICRNELTKEYPEWVI